MPRDYRGKLSRGCDMCRTRRVKCDETRPVCQKCAKGNRHCEYRDVFSASIIHETNQVAKKAQSAWRQRAKSKDNSEASVSPTPTPTPTPPYQPDDAVLVFQSSPQPYLSLDVHDLVRSRFFFDYVLPLTDSTPNRGVLDFLPDLYLQNDGPGSALSAALSACSYSNFNRRFRTTSPSNQILRAKYYGEALSLVKNATQCEATAKSDQLLVAVYLLGIYEINEAVVSGTEVTQSYMETHAYGLAALLRLRQPPSPDDGTKYRIYMLVHLQMLVHCLRVQRASFIPFMELLRFYDSDVPVVRLLSMMHLGVDALADLTEYSSPGMENFDQQLQALQRIIAIDEALKKWKTSLPAFFAFEPSEAMTQGQPNWLASLFEVPGAPLVNHEYESLSVAYLWNIYRMLRIILNRAILKNSMLIMGNGSQAGLPPFNNLQPFAVIGQLIEEICSSVYLHLSIPIAGKPESLIGQDFCGIRVFLISSPLRVAGNCLRSIPGNDYTQARANWTDHVLSFIVEHHHRSQ